MPAPIRRSAASTSTMRDVMTVGGPFVNRRACSAIV